jgi:hypothetical protein
VWINHRVYAGMNGTTVLQIQLPVLLITLSFLSAFILSCSFQAEGTIVEFETELEGEKQKAINVTAPGGGPIEPPVRKRRPRVSNGKGRSDKPKAERESGDAAVAVPEPDVVSS